MRHPRILAKVRRRTARAAWRVALGPVSGAVPHRYFRSLVEQAWQDSVWKHIETMDLLRPAYVHRYNFGPEFPAEFRRQVAVDDRYIYGLRDVCVAPRTGLCWFPGGPILEESYGPLLQLTGWGYAALDDPLLGCHDTYEEPIVVLPNYPYFHWLLEALPAALHGLAARPDATLLLPDNTPRYVDEAVELLNITRVRRASSPVHCKELILPARVPFYNPEEDIAILREKFLPSKSEAVGPIYVSRSNDTRGPANEDNLERALETIGIEIVHPQMLPLAAQIARFSGATFILGTHGAGLANIVWSLQRPHVHELFVDKYFNDCYARLSVSLGFPYTPFYCTNKPSPHGSALIRPFVDAARRVIADCGG